MKVQLIITANNNSLYWNWIKTYLFDLLYITSRGFILYEFSFEIFKKKKKILIIENTVKWKFRTKLNAIKEIRD